MTMVDEAAIHADHEGREVPIGAGRVARVRPLTMGDLLKPQVARDFTALESRLQSQLVELVSDQAGITLQRLLGVLEPVADSLARLLALTVDVPMGQIALRRSNDVMKVFFELHFSAAQCQVWAALIQLAVTKEAVARLSTPETPSASSPATASEPQDAGGGSPSSSLNTGSGAASAPSGEPTPGG